MKKALLSFLLAQLAAGALAQEALQMFFPSAIEVDTVKIDPDCYAVEISQMDDGRVDLRFLTEQQDVSLGIEIYPPQIGEECTHPFGRLIFFRFQGEVRSLCSSCGKTLSPFIPDN